MKQTNETLSDKRRIEDDHMLMLRSEIKDKSGYGKDEGDFDKSVDKESYILSEDVKEFIKDLKEESFKEDRTESMSEIIDRLAGEKLI